MKVKRHGPRRGVAGILIATILFAMIFTAGLGYLLFQEQADNVSYAANLQAQQGRQLASQEQVTFCARPVPATSCRTLPSGTSLTVTVNNTGSLPLSVTSWFVKDTTGKLISSGVVQLASPLNLDVGGTGQFSLTGYSYTPGALIYVSLVTSRGNVFTEQYPLSTSVITTTITSATTTMITGPGSGGGNSLVVVMAATPVQVFSGSTITDNVTLYNYSNAPMSGLALVPAPPNKNTTGTATATPTGCTGPFTPPGQVPGPPGTIPAYTGTGTIPAVFFLCTYLAASGQVGGLASFSGAASAIQGTKNTYSAAVTSNLVQIGGLTNPIAQGAFTSNFFFFKYSSCFQSSSPPPCTPNYSGLPNVNNFPGTAVISAGSNYYVAFYLQLTNNFNTPLPILQYTFEQFEAGVGNESDWWIAGVNNTAFMTNGGVYYPTYGSTPTLTAYPTNCNQVNANNVPTNPNCIYVDPGKSVYITLAACGPGVSAWDWSSSKYGAKFDSGAVCTSAPPGLNNDGGASGSATAAITVISYEYNGAIYTQDIAFQGVAFVS